jgi:hypothetical protein
MTNPVVGQVISVPTLQTPLGTVQDSDGNTLQVMLAQQWYRLLLALFNRTGGGNGIPTYNAAALSDGPGGQSGAPQLTPILNFVTASGQQVVMPAAMNSDEFLIVIVINGGVVNIFPPPGCQIDALGVNAPYVMAAGPCLQMFWFASPTQCYSTKLG